VTVVFSDLSGSTGLGERLDPESMSQVMARYHETMRAVVRHHGGTVEKFRHLLVRDAVYQAVPKQVRADLHERLAGLLETRAGARVREYEEIVGYHLAQAWRCLAGLGLIDQRGRELGARAAGRLATAGRRALGRGDTPAAATCSTGRWRCCRTTTRSAATCSTTWPRAGSRPATSVAPARS
jgi:hypothetical protein